jgi:uncharacterized protein (DUF2141 family)
MKIICLLFLFAFSSLAQTESGEIKLIINDTKTDSGIIRILIFNQAEGFPEESKKALKALSIPVKNSSAQTTISGLPSGNYAISVFHDEDEDGVFKKNSFGLPKNSYGFSNNPSLFFGPPSFSKCKVEVNNKPVLVEIILK